MDNIGTAGNQETKVREEIEEVISSLEGVSLQRMAGPCDVVVLEIETRRAGRIPRFRPPASS